MATKHSFPTVTKGQPSEATRNSKTREYVAVIVATVTEDTMTHHEARIEKALRKVEAAKVELAEAQARFPGVSERAALDRTNALASEWHQAFFEELSLYPISYRGDRHEAAKASLIAKNTVVYPYGGTYAVASAHSILRSAIKTYEILTERPTLGDTLVVSWHLTERNAHQGLNGRDAKFYESLHYSLSVHPL